MSSYELGQNSSWRTSRLKRSPFDFEKMWSPFLCHNFGIDIALNKWGFFWHLWELLLKNSVSKNRFYRQINSLSVQKVWIRNFYSVNSFKKFMNFLMKNVFFDHFECGTLPSIGYYSKIRHLNWISYNICRRTFQIMVYTSKMDSWVSKTL